MELPLVVYVNSAKDLCIRMKKSIKYNLKFA